MKSIVVYLKKNPLLFLLVFLPLAFLAEILHWGAIYVFAFSAIGVIPLAGLIGSSTEALAAYTGPKVGGLLNATLGNAAELIITLVAIRAGLLDLVKASITGSILGNLLLVMGFSMFLGGVKNGKQKFDRANASNHSILLTLAVLAMVIPSIFSHYIGEETSIKVEAFNLGVAGLMIVLYALGLIYTFKIKDSPITYPAALEENHHPSIKVWQAIVILGLATLGVVVLSELLVGAVELVVTDLGLSEFFLGIILIPIVGNVAEHIVAVQVALKNQMDLSYEIAVSSSQQIALFVAPVLVFISLAMGNPLTLIFIPIELIALGAAIFVANQVATDGESNWLEGVALIAVYLILGLAFFMIPG
jgi:Ca2+:H+ antiporter